MEKQQSVPVIFDYTAFLGASSSKKWTFFEVFKSIAPVFSVAWNENVMESRDPEERLWQQAMNELSTQDSDERNLIRLFEIAKDEGIGELKLMMPYDLDNEQLKLISKQAKAHIHQSAQDEFVVYL